MHKILLSVLLSLAMLLGACSKEKRTENLLYKHDGSWKISTLTYTYVSTDENNFQITLSATAENAGKFEFNENGGGSYNFTLGNLIFAQNFKWTVSDESISLTQISQNIDFFTGNITQSVVAFSGEKTGKKQIQLTGTETHQSTSDSGISQYVLTITDLILNKE